MTDNNVIELRKLPETAEDALICVLRRGAQELLTRAIEEEAKIFLESYERLIGENGLKQVVRNGYLPERSIPRLSWRSISRDHHFLIFSQPSFTDATQPLRGNDDDKRSYNRSLDTCSMGETLCVSY